MNVYPILAALRRHKAAVVLIVLQIALTLAIIANGFFIVGHTIKQMNRPTGVDEQGLIWIQQKLPAQSGGDAAAMEAFDVLQRTDLETLRKLPDVRDAAATTGIPQLQGDDDGDLSLDPDRKGKRVHAAYYYGDEHLRATFGLHLIAGRDFLPSEIGHGLASPGAAVVIVSEAVANQLFPRGHALGQTLYQDGKPATIVGIVERLRTPMSEDSDNNGAWASNSVIEPLRADASWVSYVVRARAGRAADAIGEIRKALYAVNPMRHLPLGYGIRPLPEARAMQFSGKRGIALVMGVICVILLSVTAAGIVGLTSFWVDQRTRQIGIRRALGARKIDILRYFQIENLLIAGSGAVIGALLAMGLSQWLMAHFEMLRLPPFYLAIGALAMLVLGQAAVLMPARRASNVPPVVAARSS